MTADKSRDVDADSSVCNVCCLGVCRGQVWTCRFRRWLLRRVACAVDLIAGG